MNGYLCYFTMPELIGIPPRLELVMHTVSDCPEDPGLQYIGAFVGGFWLTAALELCPGDDPDKKHWIPRSAIQGIELFDRLDPDQDELELDQAGPTI